MLNDIKYKYTIIHILINAKHVTKIQDKSHQKHKKTNKCGCTINIELMKLILKRCVNPVFNFLKQTLEVFFSSGLWRWYVNTFHYNITNVY